MGTGAWGSGQKGDCGMGGAAEVHSFAELEQNLFTSVSLDGQRGSY